VLRHPSAALIDRYTNLVAWVGEAASISDRTQVVQHAGEADLLVHHVHSPVAEHFISPGPLHGFVGRRGDSRTS
jgi:hypothetical protein